MNASQLGIIILSVPARRPLQRPGNVSSAMSNLLPKSRLVKINLTVALPISATLEQVDEWVKAECGHRGQVSPENPLLKYGLEAICDPVLTDTRAHLHSEVIENQDGTYSVRRWTENHPAWESSDRSCIKNAG
jgi:hypothetical protein